VHSGNGGRSRDVHLHLDWNRIAEDVEHPNPIEDGIEHSNFPPQKKRAPRSARSESTRPAGQLIDW
jgi:hypothetical protein